MEINLAIISILAISGLVFAANKILPFRVCPICAGVAGTWILMLFLRFAGYAVSIPVMAMLLGGSVVGIAYQLEKSFPQGRSPLLFKMFFIAVGFIGAWGIIEEKWILAAVSVIALSIIAGGFLAKARTNGGGMRAEIKKKLEECC